MLATGAGARDRLKLSACCGSKNG